MAKLYSTAAVSVAYDANLSPVSEGLLYVYENNTTTPVQLFSDEAQTINHPFPVVANGAGVFPPVYLDNGIYTVNITDPNGDSLPEYPANDVPVEAFGSDDLVASEAAAAASAAEAEAFKVEAEAVRDASFVNADVYADIATGRAAVADGEQFNVVSEFEVVRYERDSASTQTEVGRYPTSESVEAVAGRDAGFINPPALADPLSRIIKIEFFSSVDAQSVVLPDLICIRECSRDLTLGGRFRLRFSEYDGSSVYTDIVREAGNGTYLAGAQSGWTWVDIETSSTALGFDAGTSIGRALVDFGSDDAFGTYAATIAYSAGGIYPDLLQSGAGFANDVSESIEAVRMLGKDNKLPFHDECTASDIRNLVRGVRLYNADKSKDYAISVCTVETYPTPLTRFRMMIANITDATDVCGVTVTVASQPGWASFVAGLESTVKLTSNVLGADTGVYAVVDLDWSAVSDFFSFGASTIAGAGISKQVTYEDGDIADYLDSDHVHEVIRCGVGETYTTLRAAVESTYSWVTGSTEIGGSPLCDRACYHHRVAVHMVDDAEYEATLLKVPEWVEIVGNGYDRTTVVREDTSANEVFAMHLSGKMRDFSITSDTASEYCVHSDDFNRNADGGGSQNRFVRQSFKRMRLNGGTGHNGWLFGCGISAGQAISFEDVWGAHSDASATAPAFGFHNTGPTISAPSITTGVKPSRVDMRGCSSPNALGVYIQTLEPAGISLLSTQDCDFNLIEHAVATGEVSGTGQDRVQWDIVGSYDGPWKNTDAAADSFTLEWLPSAIPSRRVNNNTGSALPKGRFVKFTGAGAVALCGADERPDGWTHAEIADGDDGYIATSRRIGIAHIDGANTSSGEWGIAASGTLDFTATTKLGRSVGGVVSVY